MAALSTLLTQEHFLHDSYAILRTSPFYRLARKPRSQVIIELKKWIKRQHRRRSLRFRSRLLALIAYPKPTSPLPDGAARGGDFWSAPSPSQHAYQSLSTQNHLNSAQNRLLNEFVVNDEKVLKYNPYTQNPEVEAILRNAGVQSSVSASCGHRHPAHKAVENFIIESFSKPFGRREPTTFWQMKEEKFARHLQDVNGSTLQNYELTVRDHLRFRTASRSLKAVPTRQLFIHDVLHYLNHADVARIFMMNPKLETIMATAILPHEASLRTSSWYPGLYKLSYPDANSFTYHLEGDYSDNYNQPNYGLVWLETGKVACDGLIYTVELIDSICAHRIFAIRRGSHMTPEHRYSMCPRLKQIPRLFRRQFQSGPHLYLPSDFYNSIWVWLCSNPKVTRSQIVNKARTMLQELQADHVQLGEIQELSEMLALVAGIAEDSRVSGSLLEHGFSKTQSMKIHTVEAVEDFFVGQWHQKYRRRFHNIFLSDNYVPSIAVRDFNCFFQGSTAMVSKLAYEKCTQLQTIPAFSNLHPNALGSITGASFWSDPLLRDTNDDRVMDRDDSPVTGSPIDERRSWRRAIKNLFPKRKNKQGSDRRDGMADVRERWLRHHNISAPMNPIMLHPLREVHVNGLLADLPFLAPGRLMHAHELNILGVTAEDLPFDWRGQQDEDFGWHDELDELNLWVEQRNEWFRWEFTSNDFGPLDPEERDNVEDLDDELREYFEERRTRDVVCEDYPCCSHCWECHHTNTEDEDQEVEVCCFECDECHHPEFDERSPRRASAQPSVEDARLSEAASEVSPHIDEVASTAHTSTELPPASLSLASEGHHLREFSALRAAERVELATARNDPERQREILKRFGPPKAQALDLLDGENRRLRERVTALTIPRRRQLTNDHNTCRCRDHTPKDSRPWNQCAAGHGWNGPTGGHCHCCVVEDRDENPNGSWSSGKSRPDLPPFSGISLVAQWPRPKIHSMRDFVSIPASDYCGLTTFAQFLKRSEAEVVMLVQDRIPEEILDQIAGGRLNLQHLHYLAMAWNISATITVTDSNAWGPHPQRIGVWGGRAMTIRWYSKEEHSSGDSHWELLNVGGERVQRAPPSDRQQLNKVATPIPEGSLPYDDLQADIEAIIPSREHSLNYRRIKTYLREAKAGHTGTYYHNPDVGLEMLKGWDEIADSATPRRVRVHVSYGAGGSNKSSDILALLQRSRYRKPGLWTMLFPRKELRNSTADRLQLGPYGFMCQTFETGAVEGRRQILIIDEVTLFPPGFIDFAIMLDPNIKDVVIIGDMCQSSFHEPHPKSGFDLSYRNSEVVNYLPYLVNPYRLYQYRHELGEVAGVPWIPAGRTRVSAAKEVLAIDDALHPRLTAICHSDAFKTRYSSGARKTYTYSGCQGADLKEDVQVIVSDDTLRCVDWNGCYTACSRVAGGRKLHIVDYSKALQENGHALQVNNPLFHKYLHLDKSRPIPRCDPLRPQPGELLYEMSDIFVEFRIPFVTHPNQTAPSYHPFSSNHLLPIGSFTHPRINKRLESGTKVWDYLPHRTPEENAKLDNIRAIMSGLKDTPLTDSSPPDIDASVPRVIDSNPLSSHTFLAEEQLQKLGAREDRELYTERHGMTKLFEDDLRPSRDPALARVGQKFMPLLKTIFPHQQNSDNSLFRITMQKRIRLATPAVNERKYRQAKAEGDSLWESFKDLLELKKESEPLDEEHLMRCMLSSEETQLAKPLNQLIANYDRAEPEFAANNPRLFIKSQLKGKTDTLNSPQGKAGQSLAMYASKVIHLFGKVGHYLAERVQGLLPKNVYWHNRMSPKDLDEWARLNWKDDVGAFSNDFTAYDQSQDQKVLAFEVRLLNYFNIPRELIDEYVWIKLNSHAFPGPLQTMRFTGEWCTLIFNTFMNMAYMNLKYHIPKGMPQCYAGDDSIFNGRLVVKKEWREDVYSLVGKEVYESRGEFCGWFITQNGIYKNPYILWLRQNISKEIGTEHLTRTSYFLEFSFLYERFGELRDSLTPLELEAHHHLTRYYLKWAHAIPGAHRLMKSETYLRRLSLKSVSRRALARVFRTQEPLDPTLMSDAFYATELIYLAERQGEMLTRGKMNIIMNHAQDLVEAEMLREQGVYVNGVAQ